MEHITPWIVLILYLLAFLLIDFSISHKKYRVTSVNRAIFETIFFV